jgi:class 3 adenylate cyclase
MRETPESPDFILRVSSPWFLNLFVDGWEAEMTEDKGAHGWSIDRRLRMDVVSVTRVVDEASGQVEFLITPDPERYDLVEREGGRFYFDRFDGTLMSVELAMDMIRRAVQLTPIVQPPQITDAREYARSRQSEIEDFLNGREPMPSFVDRSEDFLRALNKREQGFVILYVDLVGSTKLSSTLAGDDYDRVVRTFLREAAAMVKQFNGLVLKYVGDAVVAYFAEPSFITKNDLALNCALSLRVLVAEALNPAFTARGLPDMAIRIGIEAGSARVRTVGSAEIKEHTDLLGFVMNIAAKIQTLAQPGEVLVGEISERNLHVRWRQQLEPVALPPSWPYRVKVFRFVAGSRRDGAPTNE